ncbi:MAG: hypothetical protein DRJ33_05580 [Candidatus Methanomethylicota archaeon]|uniref:Polymerase nucleotidyl transferase domain-containing protein n=1 Tax=Thermoproteota archaeon TaxID=2056631 RepID=A0A497EY70_9CREN|nr:MAG: hypothetical protein DRJ33_05580 [Candidatus Verstraetearchaeota archaeon]
MAKKPVLLKDKIEVVYDENRWSLLRHLRDKAKLVMEALSARGLHCVVHGSVARGDVHSKSDVDVVIPFVVSSFVVESALLDRGLHIVEKTIVQATPYHVIKAHIALSNDVIVTFPLVAFKKTEREFYKFGGEIDLSELQSGKRVPGVDKRLILIIPTDRGHLEQSILGLEGEVSRLLRISLSTVEERKRVLLRRDDIGRTGVFLKVQVPIDESFEKMLKEMADRNPAVRKTLLDRQTR